MLVKTYVTTPVDPEADTAPPTEPARCTVDLLDFDNTLDAAQPPKLLGHEIRLQSPLRLKGDMLPVTAPAPAWACVRTRRRHPVRRGLDDLECVRSQVGLRFLGDRREDALAGQTMADEHDPTILGSRDTTPAGRCPAGLQLQEWGSGHGMTTFWRSPALEHEPMVPPVGRCSGLCSSPAW